MWEIIALGSCGQYSAHFLIENCCVTRSFVQAVECVALCHFMRLSKTICFCNKDHLQLWSTHKLLNVSQDGLGRSPTPTTPVGHTTTYPATNSTVTQAAQIPTNPASQVFPGSNNMYTDLNTQATFDFLDDLPSQDQMLSQGLSDTFLERGGNDSLYHTQPLEDSNVPLGGLGR